MLENLNQNPIDVLSNTASVVDIISIKEAWTLRNVHFFTDV